MGQFSVNIRHIVSSMALAYRKPKDEPLNLAELIYPTVELWESAASDLFGPDKDKWAFKCPCCGNVQTIEDFKAYGIDRPEHKVYASCLGKYAGLYKMIKEQKKGCNYSATGLFNLSNTVVIDNGVKRNVFDFANIKKSTLI